MSWLSAVAGIDLLAHGSTSTAEQIRDTAVAQPLIVASGLVSLLSLFPHPAEAFSQVGAGVGHSVGEITAAAGAGTLSAEQAVVFARERGRAMATASATLETSMIAILGGDPQEVLASVAAQGLTAANHNGPGQVVAAGTIAQIAALQAAPPAKSRLIPLNVAGAFHTVHMQPAVAVLARHARAITTHDPRTTLLSNVDGQVVHDGQEVLRRLVSQVSNPVRWDLCVQTMRDLGVTAVIEIPPAGVLTGLVKRALPGVQTLALKSPADLETARSIVAEHGQPNALDLSPTWRLVVAPTKGTIAVTDLQLGADVSHGQTVATVASLRDCVDVVAPHGGQVLEWLVEDGDPVSPGQPIIRLHPEQVPA